MLCPLPLWDASFTSGSEKVHLKLVHAMLAVYSFYLTSCALDIIFLADKCDILSDRLHIYQCLYSSEVSRFIKNMVPMTPYALTSEQLGEL